MTIGNFCVHLCINRYKIHGDVLSSKVHALTNGKKKKIKIKNSNRKSSKKANHSTTTRTQNATNSQDNDEESEQTSDDDDDEHEPMDFERAFGIVSDSLKVEPTDTYQTNGDTNGLNAFEGELYFDLWSKVDLKTYTQPVLVSSTINLNPLAAVSIFYLPVS